MKRSRLRRRVFVVAGGLVLFALVAFAGWVVYLDHLVTREFTGRLWFVPARVYAAPVELYAGAPLSADDLEEELVRLHYRSGDPASGPGSYRRRGGDFDLSARRVRFIDEERAPARLAIHAGNDSIGSLKGPDGAELPLFRLDPPLVGSVFPVHGEDRIVLTPAEVTPLLKSAIKAVEDRRFDEHHGVDYRGILRALWADLRSGHATQGGSTLTQQLVKNYFLSDERTLSRKATEIIMALRLEARFPKEDILVAYLNEVYLGQDGERAVHGFGLAAEFYFAKPLAELDVSEVALLVGIVRGPSYYDPRLHPDRARARRNLVLEELTTQHIIDAPTAARAKARPLGLRPPGGGYVPAFLDLVRRHLKRDYAEADLAAAGLSVYTTLDSRAQAAAERAMMRGLRHLDAQSRLKNSHLEGAMIIAEPNSGDVVAVVGGREVGADGFNRALDAHRPIGSLVKPAIYLTALETGRYNAASVLEDAPLELKLGDGTIWAPQNYTREVYGSVPMARALAESMNLATVRLGLDLGVPRVIETLNRLGLESKPTANPSLLLGALDLTPLEVVQIYTALANGGFRARLRSVRAVLDEHGVALKRFKVEVEAAAPPTAVYELDRMLTLVTTHGTGRGALAHLPAGTVVAAKTGTSSDTRDSWFAGFTGSYLGVVWVGYDDNKVTGLTGASGALPIWADAIGTLKSASFEPTPAELAEDRWIEFSTGLGTTPACSPDAVAVAVTKGTVLPMKPGCGGSPGPSVTDKIATWLKNTIH